MSKKEFIELKVQTIQRLIAGEINREKASILLDCSVKTVTRMKRAYLTNGEQGLMHGNTDRPPKLKIDGAVKEKILKLYSTMYDYYNFLHFHECLKKEYKIEISYSSLESILKKAGYISPMSRRKTRKEHVKQLERKVKHQDPLNEADKNYVVEKNILDIHFAHGRIPRSKYFGEVIQIDASYHLWFGEMKSTLHLAVDNATNLIVGAYFQEQETLKGYYHVLSQILTKYGIPASFLADNRTIFYYKSAKQDVALRTQFELACSTLGIDIQTTSIPQAKGRV